MDVRTGRLSGILSAAVDDLVIPGPGYVYDCLCQFFFFFQAEDGIRDLTVTGVQTCALPISATGQFRPSQACQRPSLIAGVMRLHGQGLSSAVERARGIPVVLHPFDVTEQIGRASCRERV